MSGVTGERIRALSSTTSATTPTRTSPWSSSSTRTGALRYPVPVRSPRRADLLRTNQTDTTASSTYTNGRCATVRTHGELLQRAADDPRRCLPSPRCGLWGTHSIKSVVVNYLWSQLVYRRPGLPETGHSSSHFGHYVPMFLPRCQNVSGRRNDPTNWHLERYDDNDDGPVIKRKSWLSLSWWIGGRPLCCVCNRQGAFIHSNNPLKAWTQSIS